MVDLLNAYRWSKSLPAVRYSKSLELAATLYAIDMAERGYMEHISPEGETPRDRALNAGFCKGAVGENPLGPEQGTDRSDGRLASQPWS